MKRFFLALVLLLPLLVNAQIVITNRGNYNNTANLSAYPVTAFTPTANSLLVAMIAVTGSVEVAPTVTSTGLTWTKQASLISPSGNGNSYHIFWARVGASPVSSAVTYNCADAGTGAQLAVMEFTGYNRDNPIKQTKLSTATTTGANPSITFNNPLDFENAYFVGWGASVNTAASTPPTNWTERTDAGYGTPTYKFSTATRVGGHSTTGPIAFTNVSTTWIIMGVEIDKANYGLPSTFF